MEHGGSLPTIVSAVLSADRMFKIRKLRRPMGPLDFVVRSNFVSGTLYFTYLETIRLLRIHALPTTRGAKVLTSRPPCDPRV